MDVTPKQQKERARKERGYGVMDDFTLSDAQVRQFDRYIDIDVTFSTHNIDVHRVVRLEMGSSREQVAAWLVRLSLDIENMNTNPLEIAFK